MKLKSLTAACLAVASLSSVAALAAEYQFHQRVRGLVPTVAPGPSLALDAASVPVAKVGLAFSYDFNQLVRWSGLKQGETPPSLSWSAQSLPDGLSFAGGQLTGTPTEKGTTPISVSAVAGDKSASNTYSIAAEGESYLMKYGDGRWKSSSNGYFAGNYARKDTISVGTPHYTEQGRRVMGYHYRNSDSSICEFRLGVSLAAGWTPSSPQFADGSTFINSLSKARLYDAAGKIVKTYSLGAASFTGEGYIRKATVPCADVNAFYTAPGLFSQVLFSQY